VSLLSGFVDVPRWEETMEKPNSVHRLLHEQLGRGDISRRFTPKKVLIKRSKCYSQREGIGREGDLPA